MGSTLRYAGLILAIVLALVAQQLAVNPRYATWGWALFAVAAILAGIAAPPLERAVAPAVEARPRRGRAILRLMLGAGAIASGVAAAWLSSGQQQPALVLTLWLCSFLLGSCALIGTTVTPPLRAPIPWTGRERLVVVFLCVVALAARTAWLDGVPRYYFDDESRVGMFVRGLLEAPAFPNLFRMGWNSWPVVGMALQGIFALFLGVDTTSLRLSSALAGTVAVLFTYLLARELFSARMAVLTAVLFACGRTAIDFSRMGICHAQVLTFETLAFWSLWRAINTGSGVSYLWTGIGLGLCLHTYNAGQLVPLLWLGWVAIAAARAPRFALQRWRGGVITVAGLTFTVLPFLLHVTDNLAFAARWSEYTGMARNRQVMTRISEAWTSLGPAAGLRILGEQTQRTWLGFNVLPADAYQLGYRGGGMLDHVSAPLFVLGLAICCARFWTPRYAFILYWWLLTMITGGVLTQAPPAFVRMVGILPVLAVLGALPLDALLRTAGSAVLRAIGVASIVLLGAAMVWDNYRTYFVIFPSVTSQPSSELARYLATTPPNTLVLLLGAEHYLEVSSEIYRLNLGDRRFANVGDVSHALPLRETPTTPIALLFGATQLTLVPYAQSLYPGVVVNEITERGKRDVMLRAMVLSAEQVGARQGLTVTADGIETPPDPLLGKEGEGRDTRGRSNGVVADPFAAASPFPTCKVLMWTGGIYWPSDQTVTVHGEAPATTTISVGGVSLSRTSEQTDAISAPVQLPRGWNRIVVQERCDGTRRLALRVERNGRTTPFTRNDLRPDDGGEGLLATYLRNDTPLLRTIDSHVNAFTIEELLRPPYDVPVHMPFTATWSGTLEIDVAGDYAIEATFSGPTLVTLDGEPIIQETVKLPEEPRTARAMRRLEKGAHALFALWDSTRRAHTSRRIFQLFWQPPNGARELIPPAHLRPSQGEGGGALPTITLPPTPTPIALRGGPRRSLSELTAQDIKFGFAPPRMNKAWSGAPISMRGIEYERGIGVHAWAELTYAVPPDAVELQAIVGLSDGVKDCAKASVRFEIRDERGTVLYDSGVVDVFAPPKLATASMAGVKAVTLAVTDAGNGIDCDHANWAEPSFLLR